MKFLKTLFIGLLVWAYAFSSLAQNKVLYKEIDTTQLFLEVHYPENWSVSQKLPAVIFFFGGGWNGGDPHQFLPQAKYLTQRGMVCFLADYRVKKRNDTSPIEALKDAKSAMRFLRSNTSKFGIDPEKIVAAGGSAGGHLAAATALISTFDDAGDDLSVNCIPNALVLFNPVIDNGPGGYGYERIGEQYPTFSPLHNIREAAPPTLFLIGTKDKLVPVETAQYYKVVMEKVGSRCDLKIYEGQKHGFFNYKYFEHYKKTLTATDDFLQSLGYLKNEPAIEIK